MPNIPYKIASVTKETWQMHLISQGLTSSSESEIYEFSLLQDFTGQNKYEERLGIEMCLETGDDTQVRKKMLQRLTPQGNERSNA